MKNGLILFGITLPFLLLSEFVFSSKQALLELIIFVAPLISLRFLISKEMGKLSKKEVFKKTFQTIFVAGAFYAIWMGFYQFALINYLKPEIGPVLLSEIEVTMKNIFPTIAEETLTITAQKFKSPLYWIFSYFLNYSFLFSIIGVILGFQFKSKASH